MTRVLHVYEHCPFCAKARMIFGLKGLPVRLNILLNDDDATPRRMVGRKLVPILQEDGADGARYMGESMEIVAHVDAIGAPVLTGPADPAIAAWLDRTAGATYRLFLPRAASAPLPEFATTGARAHFIRSKEKASGALIDLFAQTPDLILQMQAHLAELAPLIRSPDAVGFVLSTDDIHLFAQLRSLTIVDGLTFPAPVARYLQTMATRTSLGLFEAIAA